MWKEQTGEVVETGIEGTGTTPDHWKYVRKEIQELGMTIPLRIQCDIDALCEGLSIPGRTPVDNSNEFIQELTKLCRKHDRYLVGPEGVVIATASEARHYNEGHRPIHGIYTVGEWKQKCWANLSLH